MPDFEMVTGFPSHGSPPTVSFSGHASMQILRWSQVSRATGCRRPSLFLYMHLQMRGTCINADFEMVTAFPSHGLAPTVSFLYMHLQIGAHASDGLRDGHRFPEPRVTADRLFSVHEQK